MSILASLVSSVDDNAFALLALASPIADLAASGTSLYGNTLARAPSDAAVQNADFLREFVVLTYCRVFNRIPLFASM